jgi:hypothetical protein
MRILSWSSHRGTAWCPPVAAMLAAMVLLAGNAGAADGNSSAVATPTPIAATPTPIVATATPATTPDPKDRNEADGATRRRAVLLLILNASGHPFGFFK